MARRKQGSRVTFGSMEKVDEATSEMEVLLDGEVVGLITADRARLHEFDIYGSYRTVGYTLDIYPESPGDELTVEFRVGRGESARSVLADAKRAAKMVLLGE